MDAQLLTIRAQKNVGAYTNENHETYTGYGFTLYRADTEEVLFRIDDLSVDPNEVQALIDLIPENDVAPEHFEDFLKYSKPCRKAQPFPAYSARQQHLLFSYRFYTASLPCVKVDAPQCGDAAQ